MLCVCAGGGHPASAAHPDKDSRGGFQLQAFSGLLLLFSFLFFLTGKSNIDLFFFVFFSSLGPEPPARGGGRRPGAKKVEKRITALARERKRHPKRAASSARDLKAIINAPRAFARRLAASPVGICKLTEQHCFSRPLLSARV